MVTSTIMAKPREYQDDRTTTALRIPPALHDRIKAAAGERGLSANRFMLLACEDFLDRLIPIEEFSYARTVSGDGSGHALPPFDPGPLRSDRIGSGNGYDTGPPPTPRHVQPIPKKKP